MVINVNTEAAVVLVMSSVDCRMQVCQIILLCVGTLVIKKLTAVILSVTDDVSLLMLCMHKI